MNKFVWILLVLCGLYGRSDAIIIFLNGTGSAGKTSIAKELNKILPFHYEVVTLDEIIWQQLIAKARELRYLSHDLSDQQAKSKLEKFDRATMDKLWIRADIDATLLYKKIREKSLAGTHVLVDTVMKSQDEVQSCLQQLHDLDVCFVLVYCPLTHLPFRVQQRNSSGVQGEKRLLRWAVQEFVSMYRACQGSDEQCIDVIQKNQIDHVIDQVRAEFNTIAMQEHGGVSDEVVEQAQSWCQKSTTDFAHQLALDHHEQCDLTPALRYDFVINTSLLTPAQCAQQINTYLRTNSRHRAMKINYEAKTH